MLVSWAESGRSWRIKGGGLDDDDDDDSGPSLPELFLGVNQVDILRCPFGTDNLPLDLPLGILVMKLNTDALVDR